MIIYTHTFLFDMLYIYAHQIEEEEEEGTKKKHLYFQSKLCLITTFHKIKFIFTIFIVKFLKSFIFNTNYQILY